MIRPSDNGEKKGGEERIDEQRSPKSRGAENYVCHCEPMALGD